MARVAPPKLSLLAVGDSHSSPEIVIEQQFKPNSLWGVVLPGRSNNNNGNQPISNHLAFHDGLPRGDGVDKDVLRQRVAEWRATCHTDANAAHNLGIALHRGEGVEKDVAGSVKMFAIAAKLGNINSAFNLGWQFASSSSESGVKQSWTEAVKWWVHAANHGHASAARNVGLLYSLGIVPDERGEAKPNHERAVHFYQLSCNLGNAKAHLALAQNYRNGQGVKKNEAKALELEEKAAILQKQQQLNPPDEGGL